jgi:hypothetical protein
VTCILPSRTHTLLASATRSSGSPLCRPPPADLAVERFVGLASYPGVPTSSPKRSPHRVDAALVIMAMLVDTGDTETGQQVLAPFRDIPPAE